MHSFGCIPSDNSVDILEGNSVDILEGNFVDYLLVQDLFLHLADIQERRKHFLHLFLIHKITSRINRRYAHFI